MYRLESLSYKACPTNRPAFCLPTGVAVTRQEGAILLASAGLYETCSIFAQKSRLTKVLLAAIMVRIFAEFFK